MSEQYVETELENGATVVQLVNPPPAQTHKTKDLTKTEWFDGVMTPSEVLRNTKAESFIDGDLSWLTGSSVAFDDIIDLESHPVLAPFAGFTYRDALRGTIKSFNNATSLDVNNQSLQIGVYLQSIMGLLDSPDRLQIILLGLPIYDH